MTSRYLDRNAGTEIPTNLIFFDTESYSRPCETNTDKRLLTLRMWCGIHVRLEKGKGHSHRIEHGTDRKSFWDWVDSCLISKKKTWLFAHNAAFDLTQLDFWDELDNGRYTIDPLKSRPHKTTGIVRNTWRGALCLESSPFFICCRKERKTINIVDTLNYWRMSLEELGKAFDLPKLDMPADDADAELWLRYCHRDVEILVRAVVELLLEWQREDCGVFQMTAPMMALTSFRHRCGLVSHKSHKLDIVCDPNSPQHTLERQAYYGGRVTCYYVGVKTEKVYHLDVNSLYPKVMHDNSFPRCYEYSRYDVPIAELRSADGIYGLVAEVLINSRHQTFPIRVSGQQYHCSGHYWTVLCGPELSSAIRCECILRTGLVQYYSVASYFREWVSYWYGRKVGALRELGNRGPVYQLAKIVLNSLSGKFAQHGRRWTERPGCIPLLRWGGFADVDETDGTPVMARGVAGVKQVLTDIGEPRYSFPAISAFITAHGREYMQRLINIAGEANVLYHAVDALIVNQAGRDELERWDMLDEYELGKLKLVGEHNEVEIQGANYYRLDGHVTASGLIGVAEKAKRKGKLAETFEPIGGIIARKPVGAIAISPLDTPTFTPDFRGTIGIDGRWVPYRVTMDPEWTDRLPLKGWQFGDSADIAAGRIRLVADV